MTYQPTRTRIAERAGMIRSQGRTMGPLEFQRAGEPRLGDGDDAALTLIRYGIALAIKRGARFSADDLAELTSDRTEVVVHRGRRRPLVIDLPLHAFLPSVAEAA